MPSLRVIFSEISGKNAPHFLDCKHPQLKQSQYSKTVESSRLLFFSFENERLFV